MSPNLSEETLQYYFTISALVIQEVHSIWIEEKHFGLPVYFMFNSRSVLSGLFFLKQTILKKSAGYNSIAILPLYSLIHNSRERSLYIFLKYIFINYICQTSQIFTVNYTVYVTPKYIFCLMERRLPFIVFLSHTYWCV